MFCFLSPLWSFLYVTVDFVSTNCVPSLPFCPYSNYGLLSTVAFSACLILWVFFFVSCAHILYGRMLAAMPSFPSAAYRSYVSCRWFWILYHSFPYLSSLSRLDFSLLLLGEVVIIFRCKDSVQPGAAYGLCQWRVCTNLPLSSPGLS